MAIKPVRFSVGVQLSGTIALIEVEIGNVISDGAGGECLNKWPRALCVCAIVRFIFFGKKCNLPCF